MAIASIDVERVAMKVVIPNLGFETFVAKIQEVKTRKGKDYFISRITIPKEAIEELEVKSGEYVFFKAKKAEWYHMLEWDDLELTWNMLPRETKMQIISDGLMKQGYEIRGEDIFGCREVLGSTNPGAGSQILDRPLLEI